MPAYQIPLFTPSGVKAAADYSASGQFRFMKITADGVVTQCSVAGEQAYGVLQNAPKQDQEATVMVHGISKVIAGEALVAGDLVTTDSSGRAVKCEPTATGADVGAWALGRVVVGAGALGEYATVALAGPVGFRVTA